MRKIIQFPARESSGYKNMAALFGICSDLDVCNAYLETVEQLYSKEEITEHELYALRRIGRQKRLDLAAPEQKTPEKADKPGTYMYTPEMGQGRPCCQMEASRAYYGKHYYIDTPEELKGRGIRFLEKIKEENLFGSKKYKSGWNRYEVTRLAYENLEKQYAISMEVMLD